MSKLLKRTFALALIFCMLLSVIPAVSADFPAANAVIFNFNTPTGVSDVEDVTSQNYPTLTYAEGTSPWYYLSTSVSDANLFFDSGIKLKATAANHWAALVLKVPAQGQYDLVLRIAANQVTCPDGQIILYKAPDNVSKENFTQGSQKLSTTVDFTLTNTTGAQTGYAYLGNLDLEAGDYVLYFKGNKKGSSNAWITIHSLTMTPSAVKGSSFIELLNDHNTENANSWGGDRFVYQLAAEVDAPEADLVLSTQEVALRGYDLSVDSVSLYTGSVHSSHNVARGITGTGSVTANSMAFPKDQEEMPITTAANTYKFLKAGTDLTTVFCTEPKDRPDAEAGSKSFGFDIGMATEAYGWDLSNMSVKLEVVVNGEEILGECNYTQEMFDDWKADKANAEKDTVFYVDVLNYAELAGKQLMFRITVTSNGVDYVITPTYTAA